MEILIWAILMVIFVIIEIATVQLVSIWLAASSLITLIAACLFDIPFIAQLGIFTLSSVILLAVTVPFLRKRLKKAYIATNSELDIGKTAVVIEEINHDNNTGRVKLNGVDWNAVAENGDIISENSIVIITEVKGSKLIVKTKN